VCIYIYIYIYIEREREREREREGERTVWWKTDNTALLIIANDTEEKEEKGAVDTRNNER